MRLPGSFGRSRIGDGWGEEPNFRLPGGDRLAGLLTDLAHEQEGNTLLLTHGLLFGVDLWPFARASTA